MQTIVEDSSLDAVVPALEANMIAFWSAYGRANGCTLYAAADVVWFYTGIPVPLFNGVLFAQLHPNAVKAVVDRLHTNIATQGAPALWWIGPRSQPAQLGSLLEHYGLHPAGDIPGMAIELAELENQPLVPAGLTIQKVTTREMRGVWAQTAALGSGFSASASDLMIQLETTLSDPEYAAQPRYLGLLDGMPVATSALALDCGVAGIYAVATMPAARDQGIGRAMTVAPLLEARERGYRVGILQASDMGYPLYQKIGFKDVCRYQLYFQAI